MQGNWQVESENVDPVCETHAIIDIKNKDGMRNPDPLLPLEPALSITEFQKLIHENQNNNLKRDDLTQLLERIHDNREVLGKYNIQAFVNEFQTLERHFHRLKDSVEFGKYYRSLADRIERFMHMETTHIPSQNRKVFNYLYAAAWGKYLAIRSTDEPVLFSDIDQYLEMAKSDIEKLPSARSALVNNNKRMYREITEQRISDVMIVVNTDIRPKIANIIAELDHRMEELVNGTLNLQMEATSANASDKREYIEQQRKLKKRMSLRKLFNAMDVAGSFAGCLGPLGMAAGALFNGVSFIGDKFTTDTNDSIVKVLTLPDGLKRTLDVMIVGAQKCKMDRIKLLDDEIRSMSAKLAQHKETLSDTLADIERLRSKLDKVKSAIDTNDAAVTNIENELITIMETKEMRLNEKKDSLNMSESSALATVEQLNNALRIFTTVNEFYQKYKLDQLDQHKLAEVARVLENSTSKFNELKQFEDNINSKMWPIVDLVRTAIDEAERGQVNKSLAALDVKQWQIQPFIHGIKIELRKFTEGFQMSEALSTTMDKLDEAFSTLIHIYDRIENYHDQEILGDYIANIASAEVMNIEITDSTFQTALNNLDMVSQIY